MPELQFFKHNARNLGWDFLNAFLNFCVFIFFICLFSLFICLFSLSTFPYFNLSMFNEEDGTSNNNEGKQILNKKKC